MLKKISLKRIAAGAFFGIAMTAFFLFVSALLLYFTAIPDSIAELMTIISTVLGVVLGGVLSSFGANGYGWLSGGLSGVLYALVLWLISMLVMGDSDFLKLLISLVFGFVAGASGGIVGINLKPKHRKKRKRV